MGEPVAGVAKLGTGQLYMVPLPETVQLVAFGYAVQPDAFAFIGIYVSYLWRFHLDAETM